MFDILDARTVAAAAPDPETVAWTGVVLAAARGGDQGVIQELGYHLSCFFFILRVTDNPMSRKTSYFLILEI